MKRLLCFFGIHKKITCYDGKSAGLSKVCLRPDCNWRRRIKTTKKALADYHKTLLKNGEL